MAVFTDKSVMTELRFHALFFTLVLIFTGCDIGDLKNNERGLAGGSTELPSMSPPSDTTDPVPPSTAVLRSRGIRLDPSYFYTSHSGKSVQEIATDVMTNLSSVGTNTVYLYAYNSIYGAYYPTDYQYTNVEAGYGVMNIFAGLVAEAQKKKIKVIAVMPLNNFKTAWESNSSWRSKTSGGIDYKPFADAYLLSVSKPEFKTWYQGLIQDLVQRHPHISGVEAVEPTLDYSWAGLPDQNQAALDKFNALEPGSAVGSQNWRNFRAQEFTDFIALFNQKVHSLDKETYLVQTWTADSSGNLMDPTTIKNSSGFDFLGIGSLSGASRSDNFICELIWQQWYGEYGNSIFSPDWISAASSSFISKMKTAGSTSKLIVHIEISKFAGPYTSIQPSLDQFKQTIQAAKTTPADGVSVYDYQQIRTLNAFNILQEWN